MRQHRSCQDPRDAALGKLLTYAAGYDAYAVIWIAESIRDEHRQALDWLNQRTDDDTSFFAVVVEVLQIDDSRPAYSFCPVVFPNQWQKATHPHAGSAPSAKGQAYQAFFQRLIDELRERHRFTAARIGQPQSWFTFASGTSGIAYGTCFAQGKRVRVEVYIDLPHAVENKRLFDWLQEHKAAFESELGEPLSWERLDDQGASRIAVYRPGSIDAGEEGLAAIRAWMIERLLRMKQVFAPYLKKYMAGQKGERAPA